MEPWISDGSTWRSFVKKILQNEAVGKMAMLGAEVALTCFLPSEVVRSCFNMYCCNKKATKEPNPEPDTIKKMLKLLDLPPDIQELINEQETNQDNTKFLEFLDVPPEVRELIYDRVTYHDIKNLRQVCRQILEEIDCMVGVNGLLNEEFPGNLEWIRSVKLRSLRVVNFWTQITDASMLSMPGAMKKLNAIPPALNPSTLKALLHGAKSVRELNLDCSDDWKMTRLTPILTQLLLAINQEYSSIILEAIRRNYELLDLSITLPPNSVDCSPNLLEMERLGYKPKEYCSYQEIPGWKDYSRTLKSIQITVPVMSVDCFDQWKILFDLQTRLEKVQCFMGTVHWSLYSKMLQNCYRTLKVIVLWDVQSFDREFLFDWSILSQCPCLEALHILAKIEPHDGLNGNSRFFESSNFFTVNMENLRELTLMFVHLDESGFKKIFNNAPKLTVAIIFFVRNERDSYPIFSILTKALKKNRNIQMVHIADMGINQIMETPDHEFRNEMGLLTDFKWLIRVGRTSNESAAMSLPMIHIMRLPIAEIWFKNNFKWSQYVNFTFSSS